VDAIIPATTNAVFRTFPDEAEVAPFGSFSIDLSQAEDLLWRNIERITRQNINTAQKRGVVIKEGSEFLDKSYELIRETFRRSRLPFIGREAFLRYVEGLGCNCKLLVAEHDREIQSCVIFAFSKYCTYAVYGGNKEGQVPGANKLLHWEAMRIFKGLSSQRYDFVGARIDPPKGSKADAINSFKRRLGGTLRKGFIWKCALRPMRALVYSVGVRLLRGGDIVDREKFKMKRSNAGETRSS
jgi:lipid II:glycine glycyltransferase (peptidoglycan interpeptide bridge formation enzyme)